MHLDISRFISLIKRDFILKKRAFFYLIISLFVITLIAGYFQYRSGSRDNTLINLFGILLLAGGTFFTSYIMSEFRSPATRMQYLMIPASHFEKFLSRWLYTLILYPLLVFACLLIVSLIFGLNWETFGSINITKSAGKRIILFYVLGHSILFMFTIWINKFVIPKVITLMILGFFLISLIGTLLFASIFYELWEIDGFSLRMKHFIKVEPNQWLRDAEDFILPVLNCLLWLGLPMFFWIVGYFKMTEKEA